MISPCHLFALCSAACTGAVVALALRDLRPRFPLQDQQVAEMGETSHHLLAIADGQTRRWEEWTQETAEEETAIEPPLPTLPDCAIDDNESITLQQCRDTNRRLNRRLQMLEHQITDYQQRYVGSTKALVCQTRRAHQYANELRDRAFELRRANIAASPLPMMDQGDRARAQALLIIKLIADWLGEEAGNYSDETGEAIGHLAGKLRSMGLGVVEQELP